LVNAWLNCPDRTEYECPEVYGGILKGTFLEPGVKNILVDYAKFVCSESRDRKEFEHLFVRDEEMLLNCFENTTEGQIDVNRGSLESVTALIALLEIYGKVTDCDVAFYHDKYEARSEYSSSGRRAYVLQDNGHIGVVLHQYEEWAR